jgi:hypothetical protein
MNHEKKNTQVNQQQCWDIMGIIWMICSNPQKEKQEKEKK